MGENENVFLGTLSRQPMGVVPIYCPGYPEQQFMDNYMKRFNFEQSEHQDVIQEGNNYSLIKSMGFDAISLWDYRRGPGGYNLSRDLRVDGWGRIYRGKWYQYDGVFKNSAVIDSWEHLNIPDSKALNSLTILLKKLHELKLEPVLSLPGLFEKTWQSMGLVYFAKCLKKNNPIIEQVVSFFHNYLTKLIKILQNVGAKTFIFADDCGHKTGEFIPTHQWKALFLKPYLELVNSLHQNEHKVIIHSDGKLTNMMPVFIEIGFDGVQSIEPTAGNNIFEYFKTYSNQICFIGNLDLTDLTFETPTFVQNYVKSLMNSARQTHNSLIISSTQQLNSIVPPENIRMMIQTAKNITTFTTS